MDYFPHTCNHGQTMFILEQRYGNDGYAFWFKLLEVLGSADGHYIDLGNVAAWEFLQAKTRMDEGFCAQILDLLARLDAIDAELWHHARVVWCQKFVDGVAQVYSFRKAETPARPSFYMGKPSPVRVSQPDNPQSKVKETKLNEKEHMCVSPETHAFVLAVAQEEVAATVDTPPAKPKREKFAYTPEFEAFWAIYPRPVVKRDAFAKWTARLREKLDSGERITPAMLTLAAKNYAAACVGAPAEKIKHPATFLSEKHPFADHLKAPSVATKQDKPADDTPMAELLERLGVPKDEGRYSPV